MGVLEPQTSKQPTARTGTSSPRLLLSHSFLRRFNYFISSPFNPKRQPQLSRPTLSKATMTSSTLPPPSDPEKMNHQPHNIQPAPTISNTDHNHDPEKPTAFPIEGEPKQTPTKDDANSGTDKTPSESPSPQQQPDHDANKTTWNASRTSIVRFLLICYSFILMGMSDGAIGALIPYLETYYSISYTVVSLVFLSPFIGYLLAALFNNLIHHHFGQRGVAILGPLCRLIGFIPMACHPPYPALPVVMLFTGFGNGIEDSAWNAWVGNMKKANELLGIIHGCYGLGATIGPLIATSMVTKGGLEWYTFYYVLVGVNGVELLAMTAAFWTATKEVYRAGIAESESEDVADDVDEEGAAGGGNEGGNKRTTTRTVMRDPIPWIVAMFLLGYVGAEVSLGGWIVTFMLKVRHAEPFNAGLTVTFFWLGLTVGECCWALSRVVSERNSLSRGISCCASRYSCCTGWCRASLPRPSLCHSWVSSSVRCSLRLSWRLRSCCHPVIMCRRSGLLRPLAAVVRPSSRLRSALLPKRRACRSCSLLCWPYWCLSC
ncbi:unnamed protein product [Sordaria macrospora k-hell]|uniref:WGS project CABT00000000 data, contig 2.15 n=1 Tax=Sordaria macrospora (strain ATCC MYA-333 / DSM 997 / K(L3346) / K-hell) TaxID=771870 RepID=F7VZG8_SORMK|nr:uncharacterized protein SMAC_04145 [Sordaria macrospora k-hell]CCC10916.1 unnamed protein product [Sordaria macrospora k-hell]